MDCLDCKICNVPYDEDGHRPRNSPCGHELCTACLGALIQYRMFECPKCRQKYKVDSPDDLPVCYGLIDVIRAFKGHNRSVQNYPKSNPSGATNDEVCKLHHKKIGHRCLTCNVWICGECLKFHTHETQCSTINSARALIGMKNKCNGDVNGVLTIFEVKSKNASLKIQEFAERKKELLEKAEKFRKEEEKLRELLQVGNNHMQNVVQSKNQMNASNSPYVLEDNIANLLQRMRLMHSWTTNNLDAHSIESLIKLSSKDMEDHTEPTKIENSRRFIHLSVERLEKIVPGKVSLAFIDITLDGVEKGRVQIRLKYDLPNIKGYVAQIFTGQHGPSLKGTIFNYRAPDHIWTIKMPFNKICVSSNSEKPMVRRGDVLGSFKKGYFEKMVFFIGPSPRYGNPDFCVIGHIEIGMGILQDCFDDQNHFIVSDCGIVIEPE